MPYEEKIKRASVLDDIFKQNAADAKKLGYTLGEAKSYSNLSLIFYYQGKYNLNVDYALKAIALFDRLGATHELAYEYGILGYTMKRRNMPNALYYMQKGKRLAEKFSDTLALMSIYNNYGVLKEMEHELDSALHFYQKGLAIKLIRKDSLGIPYSYNNIAGIYVMQKKYDAARELFEKAFDIRTKRGDAIGVAENLTYFGDMYFAMEDYSKALSFYEKSVQAALLHGYIYLVQDNYKRISECHQMLGDEKAALTNYKLFAQFKDSLVNVETNAKIAELDVRFETSEKEKQLAQQKSLLLQREIESRYKTNVLIVLSILSVFIALTGFLIYRQQRLRNRQLAQEHELKTAIDRVETQNKLQEQRLRISRDLHDNIGSQLTFIISSIDNIKYAFDLDNPKLNMKLEGISNFTQDTILELRDTIWAMNSNEITFENLLSRIANFIDKAQYATDHLDYKFEVDANLQHVKLTSIVGMNIYRTVQEAVNNAIKYSGASLIQVKIRNSEGGIAIEIQDNGRGFDSKQIIPGNGIANMEKRISDIDGKFSLESAAGSGTQVSVFLSCKSDI